MNIVLAHGILGFSRINVPLASVDYFAGVADHLRQNFQARVIAPAVNPTAGTDVRAKGLADSIKAALVGGSLNPAEPIHIIAHSMGGLDARRLICQMPVINGTPIRTLATIGTPHRGSPIADIVSKELGGSVAKQFLAQFNISLDGLRELTSAGAASPASQFAMIPGVRYLSYGGGGRTGLKPPTALSLALFHETILLETREQNDGLVTVSSANLGEFDTNLWPADHADEVGHNLDFPLEPPHPEILARYDGIVRKILA